MKSITELSDPIRFGSKVMYRHRFLHSPVMVVVDVPHGLPNPLSLVVAHPDESGKVVETFCFVSNLMHVREGEV